MIKSLKKPAVCICILSLLLAEAAGCRKKSEKNNDDGNVTVISVGDIPSADIDPEANKICMKRISDFEKKHPEIKIEPDTYVFSPDTYAAMAEAETLPTTYHLPFTQAKLVIDMEYTADVAGVLKKEGIYEQINDTILEKISKDGKIYLIPESCYDSGIALNMKLFRESDMVNEDGTPKAPTTWEELVETAQKIKEKTGKDGFSMPASGWRFMPVAWSFGGEFLEQTPDGKWKAVFDSPEVTEALQYIKDLKWKYKVLQENALISTDDINQLFASGETAMMFAEPGQVSKCTIYGMELGDVGMIQMPAGPKKHVTLMGGTYSAVRKGASEKEIEAVITWLKETSSLGLVLSDEVKNSIETQTELDLTSKNIVGADMISPWKSDNPVEQYRKQLRQEKANINLNYVKLYNDKSNIEFREEEPVATNALYRTLGDCIQEIWTNENADCAAVLKQAASDFQKNHLDNLK